MVIEQIKKEKFSIYTWIVLFIIIQPILDLFTSLNVRYLGGDILSVGVILRSIFMVSLGLHVLISKKYSKVVKGYLLLVGFYLILFFFLAYEKGGLSLLLPEVKGVIKSFYFPIVLVALFEIHRVRDIGLTPQIFKFSLGGYLSVIFVATITGTSFNSYDYGYGSVGWFFAANEIGAIVAMLLPYALLPFLEKRVKYTDVALFLLLLFSVFYIGTKVPPLSLFIYMGMMAVVMVWLFAAKNRKASFSYVKLSTMILLLGLVMSIQSPLTKNVVSTYGHLFAGSGEILTGEITEEEKREEEKDKEIEQAILSSRNLYNDMIRERFEKSDLTGKMFGIGYYVQDKDGKFTDKMIEMDAYDIYYRHGVVGSILYFAPLVLLGMFLLKRFFASFSMHMKSYRIISYCYAIVIGLAVGLLTGHVLTSPAVSIYIVTSILMLYSMIGKRGETSLT